jgi:amidase
MDAQTFFSRRFHYTFGPHEPMLRVASGQILKVICPDGDNTLSDGLELPRDRRQPSAGSELFEGNPLAGPIYVEGTTINDSLAIDILDINLNRADGLTLLAPTHGLLTADDLLDTTDGAAGQGVPKHLYRWRIDNAQQTAHLTNPLGDDALAVPLRPMIGCVGVCPNWGQTISSLYAGTFGGNLDLTLIAAGATLLLPVYHAGGLLLLGDLHAAQGHGEIVGGGIETSGEATIAARRVVGRVLGAPRLITDEKIYAIATCGDLRDAVRLAYARLIEWLAKELSINRWDAYQVVSQAATLELGGIAAPSCCTVVAGLRRDLLPARCQPEIESWRKSAGR